ncbi:hypothetical protein C8Q72DRAFT_561912 [Fomitopsis betulina]|nr:hypothetical protein C8Q72DRAFT_561912 [Fomitopsis betulina]
MSSSMYADAAPDAAPHRPATISELAARAQDQLWDPTMGLKHWLRTAEKARRNGDYYADHHDFERAFVEYARAATIVLEKLPTHRDYNAMLNADQRQNLGMNGQDILESLSQLKPVLVERHEQWQAAHAATPSSSRPSTAGSYYTDTILDDHTKWRRENERSLTAIEMAKRETDYQRGEQARRDAEERNRQAQRDAEERDRRARDESVLARQQIIESRRREEQAAAAERRAAEAKMMAEQERQAERARLEEEARKEGAMRRATDERRRRERDGIVRRQQEAETAVLAARMDTATRLTPSPHRSGDESTRGSARSFPVAAPQPAHAPNSSQQQSLYGTSNGLSIMPLESPAKNDDDSSTDPEGMDRQPWRRQRHDHTPSKSKQPSALQYPPSITTTSPAPPEGPIRYPSLMSQHQLKQGYVPSLQSMFTESNPAPPPANDSSLLFFDSKPPISDSVIPPPPPISNGHGRQGSSAIMYPQATRHRGPSPVRPSQGASASRIVQSTSTDSRVRELKTVRLPRSCLPRFLSIARVNTLHNRETCGLLLGKDKGSKYVVTTLLIPRQHSTSDTCTMDEEELVLQFTEERNLFTLGWIHTHPTQSCFMSSVDLHTHSGFQRMLPESFAVVCAPTSNPTFGIFRLTDPGGLQVILDCTAKEAFHPHPEVPIYTDCDNSHVQMKDIDLEIVDLR